MDPEPRATYRLQLRPEFDFDAAAEVVGYLDALGVSHLYASPYLQAAEGSTHGYDVVDPGRVNVELGGEEGRARMCQALSAHDMGQLLDVVPNHMAITSQNPWWWDVLEAGPDSPYAGHFDLDWTDQGGGAQQKLLLPVLGDHYGRALEDGQLGLERDEAAITLRYYEHSFPVAPASVGGLLEQAARRCGSNVLAFLGGVLRRTRAVEGDRDVSALGRDRRVAYELLARHLREDAGAAVALDAVLEEVSEDPDALDRVLDEQRYRLAFWRMARAQIDYRRFFDINSLIGVRVEREEVFQERHARLLGWLEDGTVDGVRVDHPDGLRAPGEYFERLRRAAPEAWVVAEKILEPGERLRSRWPIDGTTGYDFLHYAGGLLVDPRGEEPLGELYVAFTGEERSYEELLEDKKRQVTREVLGGDLKRLTSLLESICARHRRHRDYPRQTLRLALLELITAFPVYRAYVDPEQGPRSEQDAAYLVEALEGAKARAPEIDDELWGFLGSLLAAHVDGERERELVARFQQITGPAMAKGAEDTAMYGYHRLVALNEVGSSPGQFGVEPEAFHRWAAHIQAEWPRTLLTSSTHDTKRSEDVRARLALLSEIPERWARAARRWRMSNERHRADGMPGRGDEYLLYQTLVGAWPLERERALRYMQKAAREAKIHTRWASPDEAYEDALAEFIEALYADEAFQQELTDFVAPLLEPGRRNALTQALLKLTAPGVPDIYQGCELWDLSLVDPDNRRLVDFERRRELLDELDELDAAQILARRDEGSPKLWLTRQTLRLRRRRPGAFGPEGGYQPLLARGEHAARVVAFARGAGEVVTVAPRWPLGLEQGWEDTELGLPGPGPWCHELTGQTFEGERVAVGEVLEGFPVGLLNRLG